MKKICLLLLTGITVLICNAQKENGIVYIEHEAIGKTKAMWAAFLKGDKETYCSFYADTVYIDINGNLSKIPNKTAAAHIDWWAAFENISITDDKPAFPDAIDYKEGGLWVQDWLRWTGIHKETGINLNLRVHTLYSFNKAGKITSLHWYFDNDIFDEIYNSTKTSQNGVVYKFHPYINIVRKTNNAFCSKDADGMLSFYTPDAVFTNLTLKDGKMITFAEMKKRLNEDFAEQDNISMTETGHPVCVCYEGSNYVVYSWWNYSYTTKEGVKKINIPMMITDIFNPDGKIQSEAVYYSSNQFE